MELDVALLVGIIGAVATVLSGSVPYYFAKKNEMEVKHREMKLKMYDDLVSTFTNFINDPSNEQATFAFTQAYHRASAYASNAVLEACHELLLNIAKHTELREKNANYRVPKGGDDDTQITRIFMAIREDVSPKEPPFMFRAFIARR